jgi:hypothetical protein
LPAAFWCPAGHRALHRFLPVSDWRACSIY